MFKRILVCVDPSSPDENILTCCTQMRNLGTEEAILAHVIYVDKSPGLEKMLAEQAWPEMERQKTVLEQAGLRVTLEMPLGSPVASLYDLAEKHDVSMIVMGTHGHGLAESMVLQATALGNVCNKLLNMSSRPILLIRDTIPADECLRECRDLFGQVLFTTDFSDTAEVAFAYLEQVVRETQCRVTLLHVQDRVQPAPYLGHRLKEVQNLDMARLQRLRHHLEGLGAVQVAAEVAMGRPGDKILEVAKARKCSLILMGTRGKGITRELLLGSVAHQVARHAERPVLFIPALR